MPDEINLSDELKKRFSELPNVVQSAILSAEVKKHLRGLADTHKLHLDQWQKLENEVMLSLLGFLPVEELQDHIKTEVGVADEIAVLLSSEISKLVFEPIREELEKELSKTQPQTPSVPPATPPPPKNEEKSVRAAAPKTYKPGEVSTERKVVHEDPYRESPL